MAITELVTFTDTGNYETTVTLDGVVFSLTLIFNSRDQHWYLNIEDETGVALRSGIKLTTANLVLFYWRAQSRPAGELLMVDPSGADREADFDAIGRDVFLSYIDLESLLEIFG